MGSKARILYIFLGIALFLSALISSAHAQQRLSSAFRSTDLPLPRFASMASDKVYVRAGPGIKYPILWVFEKKNYPVEIVLEYENWRKIRDRDGEEGWVHLSLLSGRRYGLIAGDEQAAAKKEADEDAQVMAYFEPGVIARISECSEQYCKLAEDGYQGWIERKIIWGVYADENLN